MLIPQKKGKNMFLIKFISKHRLLDFRNFLPIKTDKIIIL